MALLSNIITPSNLVQGAASSTDNAIARFDGTTGKLIQNSLVTIADNGDVLINTPTARSTVTVAYQNDTGNGITLANTSTASNTTKYSTVDFGGTDTVSTYKLSGYVRMLPADGNYVGSSLAFATRDSDTVAERMRIDNSGRVGIGTASPTSGYLLDVAGGIKLGGAFDETVFAVSGTTPALSPSNGTIQTWTLSGNSTPTAGTWNDGESLTLMVLDGTAFTITWTSVSVTWVGGSAPTLDTTKQNVIELWKVGGTIYGASVGAA